ncbi:MAG: hypothetical protein ACOCWD_01070 [Tangfeifania sp.]
MKNILKFLFCRKVGNTSGLAGEDLLPLSLSRRYKIKISEMKKQDKERRQSKKKLVYSGYQSKILRYDISHERFVVPWQMDRKDEEITIE